MTILRPLLITLLLSLFITTNAIAGVSTPGDIVFPARIYTNEAFKITVSGFFSSANSVTNHQITISGTNITIDVFAKNPVIILPMLVSWQVTANIPPLEEGDYSVAVVMHGNNEPTHLEQTENFSVMSGCRPKITALTFTPAQTTDQTPEVSLTFTGNETSFYIVQSSTNLLNWTDEVIGPEPTDSTYSTSLPLIDNMRFYRIIEPLPDWFP